MSTADPVSGPVLGVDLGGTKVAAALVDPDGRVIAHHRRPTRPEGGPEAVVGAIQASAQACLADAGEDAAAVGVGVAGQVDEDNGVVRGTINLPGWRDVTLASSLRMALGLPVVLTNDVRAATWGEWRHGAARGMRDVVCVFVGTGVGGGVVSGGRVLRGFTGTAAELGHVTLVAGGRPCRCPNTGCLEAYVGGWAIAERAREAAEAAPPAEAAALLAKAGGDLPRLTARHLAEAAEEGDPLAGKLVEETGVLLGAGLVGVVNAFNPGVLVLGGGVLEGMPQLLGMAERAIREGALPAAREHLCVVESALGPLAGVVGAAAYARERALAPLPSASRLAAAQPPPSASRSAASQSPREV